MCSSMVNPAIRPSLNRESWQPGPWLYLKGGPVSHGPRMVHVSSTVVSLILFLTAKLVVGGLAGWAVPYLPLAVWGEG